MTGMRFRSGLVFLCLCCLMSHRGQTGAVQGNIVPDDETTDTWLPRTQGASSDEGPVDEFLRGLNGSMRILACQYEGPKLVSTHPFKQGRLNTHSARWSSEVVARPVNGHPEALDLYVTFKMAEGSATQAGVAVAFDFSGWRTTNTVLIPGAVYDGNRCRIVDRGYAQGLDRTYLYEKEIPLMSTPLPQLSPDEGKPSKLGITASNATTPAMLFYCHETKRAFILLAEQRTPLGDNGFVIQESVDRKRASFVVSAPGVREQKPLFVGFADSPDRGVTLKAGDEVRLHLRVYSFSAEGVPGLLERFMTVRKAVTGQNHPRNLVPFSQVSAWMTERIDNRWHEGQDHQFYCPENAQWISFGWVGGLMNTFPMLALGDDVHLDRVVKTFDFAIPRAQGDAGYFYGALNHDGTCFSRDGYPEFPEIALTRKNADVLFWMVKQFMLLKAQGREAAIKPTWEYHIKRLADAFVATWRECGQWGSHVNNQTGQVAVYNTSGGVMAIGGLALASRYYGMPAYLQVARDAAEFYYERDFVKRGMTTGGCADILQNADSETAAGFMEALMALYEMTGEDPWLEKSRQLANLTATWTVSYDYVLPSHTELAQLGAKLTGVYWASTQNKHGAPGICTSSGDSLFKIYRATGDRRYAELLHDIVHAHGESIRPGGFTNERLTYCDADAGSVGNRGNHVTGWNELNGILMAMEIPGIYIRTDKDEMVVFDHVEVKNIVRHNEGVTLDIMNATPYPATVTVLAETSEVAGAPLGTVSFLHWPRVTIDSGKTHRLSVTSDGRVVLSRP
jgi:hypothetical protein